MKEMSTAIAFGLENCRFKRERERDELRNRIFAPKTIDLEVRDELRNHTFTSTTTGLKERDELRTRISASKISDLNWSPEPLNLVKLHSSSCTKNCRSEVKSEALKHEDEILMNNFENGFWHLRVKLRTCFLGGRVVPCRAVSCRVGLCRAVPAVCFFVIILNNARNKI